MPSSPANALAPDWAAVTHDVCCPLCDYNLRGLAAPRCPECGHGFAWAEVLDPKARVHPFLFEHHPERNVRSFARTLAGSANPTKFWTSLSPAQPSRPRRLFAYWVLTSALLGLAFAADLARAMWVQWEYVSATWGPGVARLPSGGWWKVIRLMAVDAWQLDRSARATAQFVGFWLIWPWATVATLMIFRVSMRRAKVRTVHVVRCVVYAFDVGAWVGLGALLVLGVWALLVSGDAGRGGRGMLWSYGSVGTFRAVLGAGLIAIVGLRLWRAYGLYMRFDHSFWTILASQVIVFLAVLKVVLDARSVWAPF
jgi:hypothetical protein